MRARRWWAVAGGLALLAAGLGLPTKAAEPEVTNGCIESVPEPDETASVQICYSLFRPAGASAQAPVPVVFHSHGWGGSRTTDAGSFAAWFEAGFGVLSFDQRGFGESGGLAHVEHPDFEGQDVQRLVDLVAGLDWVAKEAPADPVLGAIGGSYGGGYQFVGAFTELRDRGATRFDALAPEITWWDLKESLAPEEVARSLWVTALYAVGATAHTEEVHKGFAYGAATGMWPKGDVDPSVNLDRFFEKNGPAWHVRNGRVLDIPVLFGQGISDNLFNLNQGLKNFENALTPAARANSIFVGYNGGHALPSLLPAGAAGDGDPCSKALGVESFGDLARRFFREALKGESTGLGGRGQYHLASPAGTCVTVGATAANQPFEIGTVATTAGPGAPLAWKIADGPLSVAGTPFVDATLTTVGVDARAFLALSVGSSPADAQIVQNNMMPVRSMTPVSGEARTIELPAVAVEVPDGQSLFLTLSPFSDMSFGHGSRAPGAIVLDSVTVRLPVAAPQLIAAGSVSAGAPAQPQPQPQPAPPPSGAPPAPSESGGALPATGGTETGAGLAALLLAGAVATRRARRQAEPGQPG